MLLYYIIFKGSSMKDFITQAELKEIVHYNKDTGVFTRLKGKGKGEVAGSLNKTRGYVYLRAGGDRYMAHRLAWLYEYGRFPDGDIDHINRDKADNRIANLRVVTKSANQRNLPMKKINTSGITGVYNNSYSWIAQITLDGKVTYLGSYDTKEEATEVRLAAERINDFDKTHGKG